ncbi:MAG: OmpA family protein [Rhodospirillaceae bacterium]|nr:OmpA family protein [Rhodospirillaceae bacterium]
MSAGIKTVSFALGVCFVALPSASLAQENIALDYANPNVSVDFSVLDDNGANLSATTSPIAKKEGHIIPGPKAPVSTLYITPAGNFKIAEPTETESEPVKTAMPKEEPIAQPPAPAETAKEEPKEEIKITDMAAKEMPATPQETEIKEPVAEPVAKPEPTPAAKTPPSAPELAKEAVAPPPEPAPIAPPEKSVGEMAKTESEMPKAPPPPPEAAPEPAPLTPVADAPAAKAPEPPKLPEAVESEPLKLEAKAEKTAEPDNTPPPPPAIETPEPPPAIETPEPPKVTAPLPESTPSVASIPPSGKTVGDGYSMRVLFEPDTAKLPSVARDELSALVKNMGDNENLRLQLLAYAGGADMSASVARRLSLSRALAVRSYLIESGIRSTRIDVRALGNKTTDVDSERVDITVIER